MNTFGDFSAGRAEAEMVEWYIRLTGDDADSDVREAFQTWIDRAPEHREAYKSFRAALETTDMALLDDASWQEHSLATILPFRAPTATPRSRWRLVGAVAASLLFAVFFGAGLLYEGTPDYSQIATAVGHQTEQRLEDGSVVMLNTDTHLRYAFTSGRRHVVLESGQAFFDVASDPKRPFIVSVGTRDVLAVGTAFDISFLETSATVNVTEGVVRVTGQRNILGRTSGGVAVTAGATARYAAASEVKVSTIADSAVVEAWRQGLLLYRDRTIPDILADIDRYIPALIDIADGQKTDATYTLTIRLADEATMLRRLEGQLPIVIETSKSGAYLVSLKKE